MHFFEKKGGQNKGTALVIQRSGASALGTSYIGIVSVRIADHAGTFTFHAGVILAAAPGKRKTHGQAQHNDK